MVVTKFAGGDGPGQPGGQLNMLVASARDTRLMTVYSYTRLIVYTPEFKLQPDILESYENKDDKEFTFKLRDGPQMVRRPALHHRGLPLLLGRHRQQQGDLAVRPVGRADGRRPAAQGRDHRRSAPSSSPGTSPTPTSSRARRAPRRSSCSGRRTTSRSSTPSTPRPRTSPRRPGAARAPATGCRSTGVTTSCTPTTTRTCRRSIRGSTPRPRRRSATSSRAIPTITASTARGSSCPMSTA